jgi:hypothetical protein
VSDTNKSIEFALYEEKIHVNDFRVLNILRLYD